MHQPVGCQVYTGKFSDTHHTKACHASPCVACMPPTATTPAIALADPEQTQAYINRYINGHGQPKRPRRWSRICGRYRRLRVALQLGPGGTVASAALTIGTATSAVVGLG